MPYRPKINPDTIIPMPAITSMRGIKVAKGSLKPKLINFSEGKGNLPNPNIQKDTPNIILNIHGPRNETRKMYLTK